MRYWAGGGEKDRRPVDEWWSGGGVTLITINYSAVAPFQRANLMHTAFPQRCNTTETPLRGGPRLANSDLQPVISAPILVGAQTPRQARTLILCQFNIRTSQFSGGKVRIGKPFIRQALYLCLLAIMSQIRHPLSSNTLTHYFG